MSNDNVDGNEWILIAKKGKKKDNKGHSHIRATSVPHPWEAQASQKKLDGRFRSHNDSSGKCRRPSQIWI
jgi:hypothetical protein